MDEELLKPFEIDAAALLRPFGMEDELLKPFVVGAAPLKPFDIDDELLKPFDIDAELVIPFGTDDDELELDEKDMGGGSPEYPFGGVVFGYIGVPEWELISDSPMSRPHASNPPTSIMGILFRSFVNACSLINRTSMDIGDDDGPIVCED